MEGSLHGSVRTTLRIRAELQVSQESKRKLAARYRINVKIVAKWHPDQQLWTRVWGLALP